MNTSSRITSANTSPAMGTLRSYLAVSEAADLLRRKPWPIVEAIEAGELRASMPSNDGAWLIRPADLVAYVERFANEVTGGALDSREVRRERSQAAIQELLEDERASESIKSGPTFGDHLTVITDDDGTGVALDDLSRDDLSAADLRALAADALAAAEHLEGASASA